MKQLLYYTLDSKFKSDQASVSGDGTSVVSVVNGVAWTKDERKAYYRYLKPNSENVTSYTITIHYKDVNGNEIAPDDFVTVEGYVGMKVSKTITAKSISGYTVITDGAKTFIINGNIEHTFTYVGRPEETPLALHILSSGTITWVTSNTALTRTIEYSKNGGEWSGITSNTGSSAPSISVNAGDMIWFRGNNATYGTGSSRYDSSYNSFSGSTAKFELEGNIMSLIDRSDFTTATTLATTFTFYGLFNNCTGLTSAEKLVLPAETLAHYCYASMFSGCTNLTIAPVLPATTLASNCYREMFNGCTSLTTAPELPTTTLAVACYYMMFYRCTSLTQAPALPARTLADSCYYQMFDSCTSLAQAPELPATTLIGTCYNYMFDGCTSLAQAPELPATELGYGCYDCMFRGCTSLTQAPSVLPATTLASNCYSQMFQGCTSLTRAPELPATVLTENCYRWMFLNCSSLNNIKAMFTTTPGTSYTRQWLDGVAATGTFVKNPSATWDSSISRGTSTVPEGWTITNATS